MLRSAWTATLEAIARASTGRRTRGDPGRGTRDRSPDRSETPRTVRCPQAPPNGTARVCRPAGRSWHRRRHTRQVFVISWVSDGRKGPRGTLRHPSVRDDNERRWRGSAKKKIRRPHQTQAQPAKSSMADSKPKKPRPALPTPNWLTEPPLPPRRPAILSANAKSNTASPISIEIQKTVIAPAAAPKSAPVPPQSRKSLAAHEQVPGLPPTPSVEVASRPAPLSGGANPAPRYPWISRQRGEQGRVIVTVTVSAKGHPREVGIKRSSGYRRLDEAAVAAVRKWRFVPAKRRGRAVAGRAQVPVTFRLTD